MAKQKATKLEVSFTGVSFGKDTARIGVKMARDKGLTLVQTEALLCGARLECTLSVTDEDGVLIKGAAGPVLSSVADVRGINVKPDGITFGLTFNIEGLKMDALIELREKSGVLKVSRVGSAGESDEPEDDEKDDDEFDDKK